MSEEESSVLFSLKELMSIEEDRIKTEEDEREEAEAHAEQQRIDAEQLARDEEASRLAAEEARRKASEQKSREESARIEAIRVGELGKARAESEQKARMEAMAAQQAHERKLAALEQDKGKKRMKQALVIGGLVVVLGGGLTGFFVNKANVEAADRQRVKEMEVARLKEEAEKSKRKLVAIEKKRAELKAKLASAADPKEIEALKKKIAEAEKEGKKIRGGRRIGGTKSATTKPGGKKACRPGDPLCAGDL